MSESGEAVWVETHWADSDDLGAAARRAGKKLEKYKVVANEAKVEPRTWRLDEHQGGGFLKAPLAFGKLVVSSNGYKLQLEGRGALEGQFGGSGLATASPRTPSKWALWKKLYRQRTLRANSRRVLRRPAAKV